MTFTLAKSAALAAVLALPLAAGAQTPFAGEDFDGGATNGGFSAATSVFTPDNNSHPNPPTAPARWVGGSFFDAYGIISRAPDGTPGDALFDFTDDSANPADLRPDDLMGILKSNKLDNVVHLVDTANGQNPSGNVGATWTFDISGRSNIQLQIDMAAIGDFESDDFMTFTYSIDGGPQQTAFDVRVDEIDSGFGLQKSNILYGITMESGTFTDRYLYPTAFFSSDEWLDVVEGVAAPGTVEFHPRDNGMDGDSVAQDGYIPITFLGGTEDIRAYKDGDFDQSEFLAYRNPLFVNPTEAPDADSNNFSTGTMLNNDFETLSTMIDGTGSTLTLTFTGRTNDSAGQEFMTFDNILLSEAAGLTGDYNSDGKVDAADYTVWRDGNSPDSSQTGYDTWADNYGATSTPPAVSVPEPTSLAVLLSAAAGLFAARRR